MSVELEITNGMLFITDEGHGWLRIPTGQLHRQKMY